MNDFPPFSSLPPLQITCFNDHTKIFICFFKMDRRTSTTPTIDSDYPQKRKTKLSHSSQDDRIEEHHKKRFKHERSHQDKQYFDHRQSAPNLSNDDYSTQQPHQSANSLPGISSIVANHYNSINNKDLSERQKSRIYFMRNFNNWIKSIIIRDTISMIRTTREEHGEATDEFVVFDLGCGKGGDLIKFQKSNITHLVAGDIAAISIEHCKDRYICMNNKVYTAEFISIDCTRENLKERMSNPDLLFDMTSCQFSFHYCFESFEQACLMIRNAAESLKIGGVFCGTVPDSNEVMRRLKRCDNGREYGNDLYSIKFDQTYDEMIAQEDGIPLFGCRYNFHLDEVVDCPEFLVHFPTFVDIARSFGLELIFQKSFAEFFDDSKSEVNNFQLLNYMDALEKYPPKNNEKLAGTARDDYRHVRDFVMKGGGGQQKPGTTFGTLSKSEWEAITLYLVFSFRKMANGPI